MIRSIQDWMQVLQGADPIFGVPLLVGGVFLMLFGWRLWRIAVGLTLAAIGYYVGAMLSPTSDLRLAAAWSGALLLGLGGFAPIKYSVAALGGVIGSYAVMMLIEPVGLRGAAWWIALVMSLFAVTALSWLSRRYVVILLTSFEGSVLLLSGFVAVAMASPSMYGSIKEILTTSAIVVPFLLLVPTTMSFFYQIAEVHRFGARM